MTLPQPITRLDNLVRRVRTAESQKQCSDFSQQVLANILPLLRRKQADIDVVQAGKSTRYVRLWKGRGFKGEYESPYAAINRSRRFRRMSEWWLVLAVFKTSGRSERKFIHFFFKTFPTAGEADSSRHCADPPCLCITGAPRSRAPRSRAHRLNTRPSIHTIHPALTWPLLLVSSPALVMLRFRARLNTRTARWRDPNKESSVCRDVLMAQCGRWTSGRAAADNWNRILDGWY